MYSICQNIISVISASKYSLITHVHKPGLSKWPCSFKNLSLDLFLNANQTRRGGGGYRDVIGI